LDDCLEADTRKVLSDAQLKAPPPTPRGQALSLPRAKDLLSGDVDSEPWAQDTRDK